MINQDVLRLLRSKDVVIQLPSTKTRVILYHLISVGSSFRPVLGADGLGVSRVEHTLVIVGEDQGGEFKPFECFGIIFAGIDFADFGRAPI